MPADTPETSGPSGFEGCEKRLEVEFRLGAGGRSLRDLPRAEIDAILALAKCAVISHTAGDGLDAYVLSESSLFVYPDKAVVKTCGTTSTLRCLPRLIKAAAGVGAEPVHVRYSRCSFMYPHEQPFQHRSFNLEVQYLNTLFPCGSAHVLGPVNGPRWHVYTADLAAGSKDKDGDAGSTLEVVMFDLDPSVMRRFFHGSHHPPSEAGRPGTASPPSSPSSPRGDGASVATTEPAAASSPSASSADDAAGADADASGDGAFDDDDGDADDAKFAYPRTSAEATRLGGIDTLLPGALVDDFLFEPCGYSCNAHIDGAYFTVHVTPERHCSFVSFETNVLRDDRTALARRVVDLFRPGHFLVQVFAGAGAAARSSDAVRWGELGRPRTGVSSHEFGCGRSVSVGSYGAVAARRAPSLARSPSQHELSSAADLLHGAERLLGIGHAEEDQLAGGFRVPYALAARLDRGHLVNLAVAAARQRGVAVEEVCPGDDAAAMVRPLCCDGGAGGRTASLRAVDLSRVVGRFADWAAHLPRVQPYYGVKCNADPAVLSVLAALGCGFACATDAEVTRAAAAGAAPGRVFFNRPWKSAADVETVRDRGLGLVSFDSAAELRKVHLAHPGARLMLCVAEARGAAPDASLRHGCEPADARALLDEAAALSANVVGVTLSASWAGALSPARFRALLSAARAVFDDAEEALGRPLGVLDLGSAFESGSGAAAALEALGLAGAAMLDAAFPAGSVRVIARPSMFLVAPAQAVAVSVLARGGGGGGADKHTVAYSVSDGLFGGFTSLAHDSSHGLVPCAVAKDGGGKTRPCDVFGPSGQPTDCLARGASLPADLEQGAWVCFPDAGCVAAPGGEPAARYVFSQPE